jgi:DHA2 family multidrug resistance protein-like MFS transporter
MSTPVPQDGLHGHARYLAIVVVSLGTILTAIDSNIVNIALPTIMREFEISAAASVLIVNAYQIGMLVSLLPLSALSAVIGYRPVFLGGMAVFVAASVAAALSQTLVEITVARAVQGIGGAGIVGVLHAVVRATYPARLLGRGLGLNSMFAASSAAAGPTVAAAILAAGPWPWLFGINVPLGLAAIAIGALVLPSNELTKERYDVRSAALSAATFGLFILALDSVSHGGNPYVSAAEFAGAVLLAPALVKRQLGRTTPFLPFDLFVNRTIPLSLAASQTAFIGQVLAFVTLPFFLFNAGFTQGAIGLAMTPWPLAMAATAPVAGILCDRYPPWLIGAIGLGLSTTGLLLVAFLPMGVREFDVVWRMAISGVGFGLFGPPNLRQIVAAAPKHRSGIVSGMIGTNRLTGQSIGAALAALVLNVAPTNANTMAMLLAASMTALAACFSLARRATIAQPAAPEIGKR